MAGAVFVHFAFGHFQRPALGGDVGAGFQCAIQPDVQGFQLGLELFGKIRLQLGQRHRLVAHQLLQAAHGHGQLVTRLDQLGLRQITAGAGLVHVGDGAIACLELHFGGFQLLLDGLHLGLGQINGVLRQQGLEIRRRQAQGQVVLLASEHFRAVLGTGAALAEVGNRRHIQHRLAHLHRARGAEIAQRFNHITHPRQGLRIVFALAAHSGARGIGADLRQQACAAHGAVLLAGFVFCDGGLVGRVILQCCAVGFHEPQRRGRQQGVQAQRQRSQQGQLAKAHDHSSLNAPLTRSISGLSR